MKKYYYIFYSSLFKNAIVRLKCIPIDAENFNTTLHNFGIECTYKKDENQEED